jgi:hypothetical protein
MMDSSTIWLFVVPLLLGLVFNAVKLMRFISYVAGGKKRANARALGRSYEDQMSFDERVAAKLRELERERR